MLLYVATAGQHVHHEPGRTLGLVTATATAACLSLLWRRRHPTGVVVITALCTGVSGGAGHEITPLLLLPVIVALYEPAARTPERAARAHWLTAVALVALPTLFPADGRRPWLETVVITAFWSVLPVVQGSAVRARRAYLGAVRARAEHAGRTREEEARHRVAEERVRIARELHDVVAHHMALANAQAGTAAHLLRDRPQQAGEIVAELAVTTSSALRELQATVLQEALTNVAKHTSANTAHIRLVHTHDRLTLTVSDNGGALPHPAPPGGGFGLVGMRERARSVGGTCQAGHRPGGGFAVTVELPVHP
ncbi:sensor histidine kinase [Streptomyces sp. NPDC017979]|uniref:sensor histidine kinase n=1 Tax=Streptomyces sp. NPDC017979 TaxID=3365024 RepID=UPI003793569B